jgi:hypothetical protein
MRSNSISLAAESAEAGDRGRGIIRRRCLASGVTGAGLVAVLSLRFYDRSLPGHDGHVVIDINGQFYESGGMKGPWGGGAGVMKIKRPSSDYLSTFDRILHPQGL